MRVEKIGRSTRPSLKILLKLQISLPRGWPHTASAALYYRGHAQRPASI